MSNKPYRKVDVCTRAGTLKESYLFVVVSKRDLSLVELGERAVGRQVPVDVVDPVSLVVIPETSVIFSAHITCHTQPR